MRFQSFERLYNVQLYRNFYGLLHKLMNQTFWRDGTHTFYLGHTIKNTIDYILFGTIEATLEKKFMKLVGANFGKS